MIFPWWSWLALYALIPAIIWLALKFMDWAQNNLSDAVGMAFGIPLWVVAFVACMAIVAFPFFKMPPDPVHAVTLDLSTWSCGHSEVIIEPVRHLVGKVIITRYEPVEECLRWDRKIGK